MNAILQFQPRELPAINDTAQLEGVLEQITECVRRGGRPRYVDTWPNSASKSSVPFGGSDQVEELVQIEMGGRVYSLMCWFRQPVEEQYYLSPREREVVRLVAKGLPNKTIACALKISAWTVATYMRRIFTKLEVNSRAEMVAKALKQGLLAESDLHVVR